MRVRALVCGAAMLFAPMAFAQTTSPPEPSQPGETSDRTPEKKTPTPQAQKDTAGGKTSDRSPDADVKVQHQPGAAGTAGSSESEGPAADEDSNGSSP